MSTQLQIKQIHILKNILGLDDDLYYDMLKSFDVCSSKNLTVTEADILIEILSEKIKITRANCHKKYDDLYSRDDVMATPPQLRKIEVVWADIYDKSESKTERSKALRNYIQKYFKVSDLRFLTKSRASAIIPILEKIKINKFLKAL